MSRWFVLVTLGVLVTGCGAIALDEPWPDDLPEPADEPSAPAPAGVVCGPGTVERDRQCVVAPSAEDDAGAPDAEPNPEKDASADAGDPVDASASEEAGVPEDAGGPDDAGEPDVDAGPAADAGAVDAGPPPLTCGPGTHEVEGVCLPNDPGGIRYEIRTLATTINADGYSKIPLVAFGRTADGAPSTEPVVFSITRPGAATLTPALTNLLPIGRTVQLVPCRASSSPACVGPLQVTMALASNPQQIVATSPVLQLVEPVGVGSPAACLVGGNVLHLDGDATDYIHPGVGTYTTGDWTWSMNKPAQDTFTLRYEGAGSTWWYVNFSSRGLGQPLDETVYRDGQRYPFDGVGVPGLSISGSGRGCNRLIGNFEVVERRMDVNGELEAFTATFEQRCEYSAALLRGCVHVER